MQRVQASKLPVVNGREIIGYASGERSATVLIRRTVAIPAGGKLYVWRRQAHMQEILDLPEAYCYAIGFGA